MRTLTVSLLAGFSFLGVPAAEAADLDYGVLRGPEYDTVEPAIDWSGVYVGGHVGYTSAALGFRNVFQPLVARRLANSTAEGDLNASGLLNPLSVRTEGLSFGAYAGYNYQFDETVLGVEVDYTRFDRAGITTDSVSRFGTVSNGYLETISLDGTSTTKIEDYGTIRARAGYAYGSFLPYVTGGLAIGRAQISDQVNYRSYGYDQPTYVSNQSLATAQRVQVGNFGYSNFNQNYPELNTTPSGQGGGQTRAAARTPLGQSKTKTVGGIALGAGLEFALTSSIILRAEYQYVLLNDFDGHKVNLNTVRAGAAVKF